MPRRIGGIAHRAWHGMAWHGIIIDTAGRAGRVYRAANDSDHTAALQPTLPNALPASQPASPLAAFRHRFGAIAKTFDGLLAMPPMLS